MKPSDIEGNYLLPIYPGDTERYNHHNCPAGKDTKKRLYLTMSEAYPHSILCYCHNCGEGTAIKDGSYRSVIVGGSKTLTPSANPLTNATVVDWNRHGPGVPLKSEPNKEVLAGWFNEKGINLTMHRMEDYGVRYDDSKNEIIYPIWGSNTMNNAVGWQTRNIHGLGPKYKTTLLDKTAVCASLLPQEYDGKYGNTVVIVEDYLSGIKISECGFSALVLYGTHFNADKAIGTHLFDNIVVWLDNDNPTVINHANTITRTLRLVLPMKRIRQNSTGCEPKYMATKDIQNMLISLGIEEQNGR